MLWPLDSQEKRLYYTLDRRLVGPLSWSGCNGEEKNPWPHLELNPEHLACNQSLYQLSCPSSSSSAQGVCNTFREPLPLLSMKEEKSVEKVKDRKVNPHLSC
jgi:hypothetical protein